MDHYEEKENDLIRLSINPVIECADDEEQTRLTINSTEDHKIKLSISPSTECAENANQISLTTNSTENVNIISTLHTTFGKNIRGLFEAVLTKSIPDSKRIIVEQLPELDGLFAADIEKETNEQWECPCCSSSFAKSALSSVNSIPTRLFNIHMSKVFKMLDLCSSCIQEAHKYSIISHAWGNTVPYKGDIFGVEWSLPLTNSEKLIKCIKSAKICSVDWIWMDILCIDQSNILDKEAEIPKMKNYYKNGHNVLVILDDLAEPFLRVLKEFTSSYIGTVANEDLIEILLTTCSKIKNDPWVKRIWTLQELILANRILLCSGNFIVDLEKFEIKPKDIEKFEIGVSNAAVLYGEDFESVTLADGLLDRIRYKERNFSFMSELIMMQKHRMSTKEHDKIYGLLGLLNYGDQIKVDYSIPFMKLEQNVIEIALKNGDTSILSFAGVISLKSIHGIPNIFGSNTYFPFRLTNVSGVPNAKVSSAGVKATWEIVGRISKVKTINGSSHPSAQMYISDVCKSSTTNGVISNASSIGLPQALYRIKNSEFTNILWEEMAKPNCKLDEVLKLAEKSEMNQSMGMSIVRSELFIGSVMRKSRCYMAEIENNHDIADPYEMSTSCIVMGYPSKGDIILDIGCTAFRWGKVVIIASKDNDNKWHKVGVSVIWDIAARNIYRESITVNL